MSPILYPRTAYVCNHGGINNKKIIGKIFKLLYIPSICKHMFLFRKLKKNIKEHVLTQNGDKDILYYVFESDKNSMEEQTK